MLLSSQLPFGRGRQGHSFARLPKPWELR